MSKCILDIHGICRDQTIGGPTSPGKCDACPNYRGPARGIGDVVALIAKATGVAAVVEEVERKTGKPCGCAARRAALNKAVPFTDQGV